MTFVFWGLVAVLMAGILYRVLKPLVSEAPDAQLLTSTREQELVEVYRERLSLLEQQQTRGEISDEQLSIARKELETSLAAELPETSESYQSNTNSWLPIIVGVSLPTIALILYFALGSPAVIDGPPQAMSDGNMPSVDEMVAGLERKLRENPENVDGWRMLGRSYATLGNFEKSRDAYLQAIERAPADTDILLSLAEVTAATQDNSLVGEPEVYLDLALQLEPGSRQGRWLKGILAIQQTEFDQGIALWQELLNESTNDQEKKLLSTAIEQARQMAGGEAQTAVADNSTEQPRPSTDAPSAQAQQPSVKAVVRVSDSLASKVSPNDSLFIYAKAETGPPMPLAIVRTTASELPIEVLLTDAQAMMPQMKLSLFDRVVVGARVSKSGDAIAKPGDLQGISATVNPKESPAINIVIDSIVP